MLRESKKSKRITNSNNHGSLDQDFFNAPHHLYFSLKMAGKAAVIKTIREICKKSNLERLSFACIAIDDGVIDTIIECLIRKEVLSLKELNVSGNNLTDVGVSQLLDAIERETECKLQKLYLVGNKEITAGYYSVLKQS